MISDIPGMTWNMIPTLAQAGIKYFSNGPNGPYSGGDRTGHTNSTWADRPFYWVSPSGNESMLFWQTGYGYGSFFAGFTSQSTQRFSLLKNLAGYFRWLDAIGYPYEIIHMRHTINGDNGTVDPDLSDYVKTWNAKYDSPKIAIATTDQLFTEFERVYGANCRHRTSPYWEGRAACARPASMGPRQNIWCQTGASCHPCADNLQRKDRGIRASFSSTNTPGSAHSITDPTARLVKRWRSKKFGRWRQVQQPPRDGAGSRPQDAAGQRLSHEL
jgi:hypothetical protein